MGTNNCTGSTKLSIYYAGAGIVPIGSVGFPYGVSTLIPSSGRLALSNFFGAMYDAGSLLNGDFEITIGISETSTTYNLTGWTIYKQTTKLNGALNVTNCFTPIVTTTPTPPPPNPYTSPLDNVVFSGDITGNPSFNIRLIDVSDPLYTSLAVPGGPGKYILELRNSGTFAGAVSPSNPNAYGIMRGPYLVSNNSFVFSVGDTLSFNWRAAKDSTGGPYAVYIYAINVNTCAHIELLNAFGDNSGGWQTINYTLSDGTKAGSYRFVAVHGSYDSSASLKVGAYLYLDNIKITKAAGGGGTTSSTTTTSTTTTGPYTYSGDTTPFLNNGSTDAVVLNTKVFESQSIKVWEIRANVAETYSYGLRGGKYTAPNPALDPGFGVDNIVYFTVNGSLTSGKEFIPGPTYETTWPMFAGGNWPRLSYIGPAGTLRDFYGNLTVPVAGAMYPALDGSTGLQIGWGVGNPIGIRVIADGGGGYKYKSLEVTQTTSPVTLTDNSRTPASTPYLTSLNAQNLIYEGDSLTVTVNDSRKITRTLTYKVFAAFDNRPIRQAHEYFIGGIPSPTYNGADDWVLTGPVAITNGSGLFTITTREFINDLLGITEKTFKVHVLDPELNDRILAVRTVNLVKKPYQGQVEFTVPGTYTWTAPAGVFSVSAVAVGAGAGGGYDTGTGATGGAGGGLMWAGGIPVTPGTAYTVVVGEGGFAGNTTINSGGTGGNSFFGPNVNIAHSFIRGIGAVGYPSYPNTGLAGFPIASSFSGAVTAGGGNGGVSIHGSGGGAGGYSGDGGRGANPGSNGNGGGGGGGSSGGNGGGVGIYGAGGNGVAGSPAATEPTDGTAGSGGLARAFGGGGNAKVNINPSSVSSKGGDGAVRIIWGLNRTYPNKNTGNVALI